MSNQRKLELERSNPVNLCIREGMATKVVIGGHICISASMNNVSVIIVI